VVRGFALHREVAYVPGDVTLWASLSGGETIDLLARLRGGLDEHRRDELIERFDLDPRKKARSYSKGNRQKVALVSALLVTRPGSAPRRTHLRPGPVDGAKFP
jgi:ABC-2 type transport system ATP-binding protein